MQSSRLISTIPTMLRGKFYGTQSNIQLLLRTLQTTFSWRMGLGHINHSINIWVLPNIKYQMKPNINNPINIWIFPNIKIRECCKWLWIGRMGILIINIWFFVLTSINPPLWKIQWKLWLADTQSIIHFLKRFLQTTLSQTLRHCSIWHKFLR